MDIEKWWMMNEWWAMKDDECCFLRIFRLKLFSLWNMSHAKMIKGSESIKASCVKSKWNWDSHLVNTWKFEEISLTDHGGNSAVFRRFNLVRVRCKSLFPKCVSQAQAPPAVSALWCWPKVVAKAPPPVLVSNGRAVKDPRLHERFWSWELVARVPWWRRCYP